MDVTGPRLSEATPQPPAVPPLPRGGTPTTSPAARAESAGAEDTPAITAIWDAPWVPRSTLKMAISSADVDARFEIDDETSRVTVTMYDRRSGEVLRRIPPAELQEIIEAIADRGLTVDVKS